MNNQEPTKPTGNLEELFRHHLAEAAVPPRPYVWEQVDNSLLLAQNEAYRKRLRVTRWVAAASLLLATLAGTGWWTQHDFQSAGVATTAGPSTAQSSPERTGLGSTKQASVPRQDRAVAGLEQDTKRANAPTNATASRESGISTGADNLVANVRVDQRNLSTASQQVTPTGDELLALNGNSINSSSASLSANSHSITTNTNETNATHGLTAISSKRTLYLASRAARASKLPTSTQPNSERQLASRTRFPTATATEATLSENAAASTLLAATSASDTPEALIESRAMTTAPLGSVVVSVVQLPSTPLPSPLTVLPGVESEEPATRARNWRLGMSYAAGVFQSNINFSRAGINPAYGYNPALGANSPALSEAAAKEHRAQQTSGLGLRLRLQAIRRLRGHWSLATGVEVAQLESHSASSYIFTGEQVPDVSQPLKGGVRQETSALYRTAGLPLELRYSNPVKTGFSLYGRVGAVFSALLTTRTNVEQEPEATRTYNFLSSSTPYRRILGSIRGAAGVQFRPVGHDYTISLGPVAEGGLWSLNRHPAQSFFSQSRPYSLGLEAGVEFGRGTKLSKL